MTYAKGSVITSGDFNALAGTTSVAASSASSATAVAGYLYGIGFGDRGYGQTSPVLSALSSGKAASNSDWNDLRTIINTMATWQGTATTLIPPANLVSSGSTVQAHTTAAPSNNPYGFAQELALLDANRLNYQVGNMTLTSNVATSTRATTWGQGGTTPSDQIICELSTTFASEDAARYFFNTGGELRVALNHPSTASNQDTAWNTILNNLVIAFRANSSVRLTGSYGTAQAVGYYQLTTSYQTILNGVSTFVSPYQANSFLVEAKATSIPGVNGGKGSVIYIRVTLTDAHTNSFHDVVQSGTNAKISHLRATSVFTNIAAPSMAVVTSF